MNVMIPFTMSAGLLTYAWPFAKTKASIIVIAVLYGYVADFIRWLNSLLTPSFLILKDSLQVLIIRHVSLMGGNLPSVGQWLQLLNQAVECIFAGVVCQGQSHAMGEEIPGTRRSDPDGSRDQCAYGRNGPSERRKTHPPEAPVIKTSLPSMRLSTVDDMIGRLLSGAAAT